MADGGRSRRLWRGSVKKKAWLLPASNGGFAADIFAEFGGRYPLLAHARDGVWAAAKWRGFLILAPGRQRHRHGEGYCPWRGEFGHRPVGFLVREAFRSLPVARFDLIAAAATRRAIRRGADE